MKKNRYNSDQARKSEALNRQEVEEYTEARQDDQARRKAVPLIVSRHQAAIDWMQAELAKGGMPVADVVSHATLQDVRGRTVLGTLPLNLIPYAGLFLSLQLPKLKADQRGFDLSTGEMTEAGAVLVGYEVKTLSVEFLHGRVEIEES